MSVMTQAEFGHHRRQVLMASLAGAAALVPLGGAAAASRARFDRAAYDRYIGLMNAGDLRFIDCYAPDVTFVMNLHGRAAVAAFYARQRPYVKERLDVLFFCSDTTGAAAEVHSELRCIKDCDDSAIFGRPLKAGEVQRIHGYLFYVLNEQGLIADIKGPPPIVLQPWRLETE